MGEGRRKAYMPPPASTSCGYSSSHVQLCESTIMSAETTTHCPVSAALGRWQFHMSDPGTMAAGSLDP